MKNTYLIALFLVVLSTNANASPVLDWTTVPGGFYTGSGTSDLQAVKTVSSSTGATISDTWAFNLTGPADITITASAPLGGFFSPSLNPASFSIDGMIITPTITPGSDTSWTYSFTSLAAGITNYQLILNGTVETPGFIFNPLNYSINVNAVDVSAVPVPAAIWLFATGLLGFVGVRRKA